MAENFGKMMGRMLRDQVGGEARPAGIEGALRLGDAIIVTKREVKQGASSPVAAGQPMRGTYLEKIQRGKPFKYAANGTTSEVVEYRSEGDKLIIETKTSVYEIRKA